MRHTIKVERIVFATDFLESSWLAVDYAVAFDENSGLIVLGVRTESHLGRHLHTSFACQLLSTATCPVLSVRHDVRS